MNRWWQAWAVTSWSDDSHSARSIATNGWPQAFEEFHDLIYNELNIFMLLQGLWLANDQTLQIYFQFKTYLICEMVAFVVSFLCVVLNFTNSAWLSLSCVAGFAHGWWDRTVFIGLYLVRLIGALYFREKLDFSSVFSASVCCMCWLLSCLDWPAMLEFCGAWFAFFRDVVVEWKWN